MFSSDFCKISQSSFLRNAYWPLFFWLVTFVIIPVNDKNWSALTNFADQKVAKVKPEPAVPILKMIQENISPQLFCRIVVLENFSKCIEDASLRLQCY